MPHSALRRGAADRGRVLAAELARRAHELEAPGLPCPPLPEADDFAVGDQLAVTGHDLAEALRGAAADRLTAALDLLAAAEPEITTSPRFG
ncbi:hypothetical protein H3146_23520 [Streptomyces sp. OF3]|uniref:Uncharacterized protein n=2 Tax=Streptomyces alkaliterrae TaxID=2213162 RepID=A0A5P0YUT4_9ACTN|nr:hypothetical protein [Streptomyces alkaliterrae]MBB1262156.1 hypothetical protein [Streptomyces alkaliterrae]MQS04061.1 hypothetical protein [Streptomyces alkaliterrae]